MKMAMTKTTTATAAMGTATMATVVAATATTWDEHMHGALEEKTARDNLAVGAAPLFELGWSDEVF
jgi:hypothetical protein